MREADLGTHTIRFAIWLRRRTCPDGVRVGERIFVPFGGWRVPAHGGQTDFVAAAGVSPSYVFGKGARAGKELVAVGSPCAQSGRAGGRMSNVVASVGNA